MALWTGLGQAATLAQLVGADIGGLVSMIVQAALTARQNRSECEQLARQVLMIAQLLPHVQEPEAAQPLSGLGDTLRDAHELVVSCQGRSAAYQFVMAGRQAERFRDDSYLILFPVISHIGITRCLERIYNVLVSDESARAEPRHIVPQPSELQEFTEDAQEVLPHRTQEFTLAEILAATNNFATSKLFGQGCFGKVYIGRLSDQRAAIKSLNKPDSQFLEEQFRPERDILSRLRHKHIIGLLGSCVTVRKDKRLLTTLQNRKKRLLTLWRKELEGPEVPEEPEMVIVYELMWNGKLYDQLHTDYRSCTMSPVRMSWKVRIDVLLGVSRAIEHLHCHANSRIVHRDIKSSNILFDDSWVPHVSDFGLSVAFHMESEESGMEMHVIGTIGYIDPEYLHTGRLKPACDVYSLGVVMLEVLTGKNIFSQGDERMSAGLASFAVPVTEAGNFEELLDRRLVPEPTPGQLKALEQVAQTARCCLKLDGKDRPAMSDIVADLKMAHKLISETRQVQLTSYQTHHVSAVSHRQATIPIWNLRCWRRALTPIFESGLSNGALH